MDELFIVFIPRFLSSSKEPSPPDSFASSQKTTKVKIQEVVVRCVAPNDVCVRGEH